MTRIAIVDDNESWCFVLQQALRPQGYKIETFCDPWRFLQQAEQFDLAIVDYCIHTPPYKQSIDGIELIQQVKSQCAAAPLLVLVSSYFPDEKPETLQSFCPEADLVLPRPQQIKALLQPIQGLLVHHLGACSSSRSSA